MCSSWTIIQRKPGLSTVICITSHGHPARPRPSMTTKQKAGMSLGRSRSCKQCIEEGETAARAAWPAPSAAGVVCSFGIRAEERGDVGRKRGVGGRQELVPLQKNQVVFGVKG